VGKTGTLLTSGETMIDRDMRGPAPGGHDAFVSANSVIQFFR
jgi:hypothetical protein